MFGKELGGEDDMSMLGITVVSEEQGRANLENQRRNNKTVLDKLA